MQKIKKYKVKFIQGLIMLAGVLVIAIILGHHIMVRTSATASSNDFTSQMLAKQAKNHVNKFLEGDIDVFVHDMFKDNSESERHIENYDDFLEDVKKEVKKIYDEEIKGKSYKTEVDMVTLVNIGKISNEKYTHVGVKVEIEGMEPFSLIYNFTNYNTYTLNHISYDSYDMEDADYTKGIGRLVNLFYMEQMTTEDMYFMQKKISESLIKSIQDDYDMSDGSMGSRLYLEDGTNKALYDRLVRLFKLGIKIESCSFVKERYDKEDRCIKGEMILVLSDKKGNKVVLIQECGGISFERKDKKVLQFSERYVLDKDAEVIGDGLEGVSNFYLKKLFRVEKRK